MTPIVFANKDPVWTSAEQDHAWAHECWLDREEIKVKPSEDACLKGDIYRKDISFNGDITNC